jgi:hypothetical protein
LTLVLEEPELVALELVGLAWGGQQRVRSKLEQLEQASQVKQLLHQHRHR